MEEENKDVQSLILLKTFFAQRDIMLRSLSLFLYTSQISIRALSSTNIV